MRGQTTLDFAIAMGVFLLTVAFVFTFIPSVTAPFIDGGQEQPAAADRIGSHLAEGALGDPSEPYVVREECASVFFNRTTTDGDIPNGCGFVGNTTHERVGLAERSNLHVEIVRRNETGVENAACLDDDGMVSHDGHGSCDLEYSVGDDSAPANSVTVATRVVVFEACEFEGDGCDAILRVEVW